MSLSLLKSLPPLCRLFLLVLPGLSVTACGPRMMVEQTPQSGLPGDGHYAWGIASDRIPGDGDPRVNNDIIAAKLQAAIDAGLTKRGFQRVDRNAATWLVHYHAGLEKQTQVVSEPLYPPSMPRVICGAYRCSTAYDWGFYGPPEFVTRTVIFHEGTLLIDIHDAKTNQLVWRGSLTNEVNINKPLNEKALQSAVDKLLLKLPMVERPADSQ